MINDGDECVAGEGVLRDQIKSNGNVTIITTRKMMLDICLYETCASSRHMHICPDTFVDDHITTKTNQI